MKKVLLILGLVLTSVLAKAQQELAFPFQGGKQVMIDYFKQNVVLSADLMQKAASGTAVIKFTADQNGTITKIIVYYADDVQLAQPVIEALRQSNHKWVIQDKEKLHDFVISFNIGFNLPANSTAGMQKTIYNYFTSRTPVLTYNQIPLDMATLLPSVTITYDLKAD